MKKFGELNDVCGSALGPAAREAVAAALANDFPADPLIGTELSRAPSCHASVVKWLGRLIEMGIARARVASDRFVVLPNCELPLTKGANQMLKTRNTDERLSEISLPVDSESNGMVNGDLAVVDPEAGWARDVGSPRDLAAAYLASGPTVRSRSRPAAAAATGIAVIATRVVISARLLRPRRSFKDR